ncbi:hypothetical protein [Planifilum fimeticola]
MTEQEMRTKYKDIGQFQVSLRAEEAERLLNRVVPILGIPFDFEECGKKKHASASTKENTVYYREDPRDPRCLILVEFEEPYFHRQYANVIIRFHKDLTGPLKSLLGRVGDCEYDDCLIRNSKMNDIVKRHRLNVDIVDQHDLCETLFMRKEFWTDYYFLTHQSGIYPELVDPIPLPITGNMGLMLAIGDDITESTLYLYHPSCPEPVQLGWDDEAQWFSHVFRWDELERISGFLVSQYPELPAVPFLLLYRFAPITRENDPEAIQERVKAAWSSLGLFTESEVINLVKHTCHYKDNLYWKYDQEKGWYCHGDEDDLYSLRILENGAFPFFQLRELLDSI